MRVIAGALGGRVLVAPKGLDTRPTSDRVREALFSVLGDLSGAVVLDLYAGTGALGIEAISRGASRAVFVENSRPAVVALQRNIKDLGLTDVSAVISKPVLRAVAGLFASQRFDLVFVDPPYVQLVEATQSLALLVTRGLVAHAAQLVLEHATRDPGPRPEGLTYEATRKYGDTSLSFYSLPDATPTREVVSSGHADG